MADLNMIKPAGVQNLINKFCYTIGMLPTSYKSSLTYEEQILAIGNYLETTVYPAINNNAQALTELQGLFTALYNYVHDYFDNLDVQEEINNKLDEMIEDGTLQKILLNYATVSKVYNTYEEMIADYEEFTNNQKIKTLGYYEIDDNGAAEYLVSENIVSKYYVKLNNNLYLNMILSKTFTPEQFGAYCDGEHDDSEAVQTALNLLENGDTLILTKKYYIATSLTLPNTPNISIIGGEFIAINNLTLMFNYDNLNSDTPSGHSTRAENVKFTNVTFNGNRKAQIFVFRNALRVFFVNCCFYNFETYAIEILDECHEINADNCSFIGMKNGTLQSQATCIKINSPDNQFSNCVFAYAKWAVDVNAIYNIFSNCHFYCLDKSENAVDGENGNIITRKAWQTFNNCYFDSGIVKLIDPWYISINSCLFATNKTPIWLTKSAPGKYIRGLKIRNCLGNNVSDPQVTFNVFNFPDGNFTNPQENFIDISISGSTLNYENLVNNLTDFSITPEIYADIKSNLVTNISKKYRTKNLVYITNENTKKLDNGSGTILSDTYSQYTVETINNVINVTNFDNTNYRWLSIFITLPKNKTLRCTDLINEDNSFKIFGHTSQDVGNVGTLLKGENINQYVEFNSGDYDYYTITFYGKKLHEIKIVEKI